MRLLQLPLDRIANVVASELGVHLIERDVARRDIVTRARRFYMCLALEFTQAPIDVIAYRIGVGPSAANTFLRSHRLNYMRMPTMEILRCRMHTEIRNNGPLIPTYKPRAAKAIACEVEIETEEALKGQLSTMRGIAAYICQQYGVTMEHLRGECRDSEFVKARAEFSIRAVAIGKSYSEIGRFLNRDHATIMHHVKKARAHAGQRRAIGKSAALSHHVS